MTNSSKVAKLEALSKSSAFAGEKHNAYKAANALRVRSGEKLTKDQKIQESFLDIMSKLQKNGY